MARGEFFRHTGITLSEWQSRDAIFPVIECRLEYKHPARYDDELEIEVWPTKVERIRLNFGHRIVKNDGTLILKAQTLHVCTGISENPRRLPEDLVSRFQLHLMADQQPN